MSKRETDMMLGQCHYCGQSQMVNAADSEDAARQVSAICKCEAAERERQRRSVDEMLRSVFSAPEGRAGELCAMPDEETMTLIRSACDNITDGRIGRTMIRLPYSRQLVIRGYIDHIEIHLSQTSSMSASSKDYYSYKPEDVTDNGAQA